MKQEQFLSVVSRAEAERRFRAVVEFGPLEAERCDLQAAWGRVIARDVCAPGDVPAFARSNMDGFAVIAQDTYGASEEQPARVRLNAEQLATGMLPSIEVVAGTATAIATGGVLPRGANAVAMVEDTDIDDGALLVRRALAPGANLSQAGSDIARGETVLRPGDRLSSKETGVLAALGIAEVAVVRRPRVAILSTGDEIAAPGRPLGPGGIHDANGRMLADAVREAGGEPVELGIVRDEVVALRAGLDRALAEGDLVLLSGGTSKGAGDLNTMVVAERGEIVVHGVALKPGKPVALAVVDQKPVVVLPGFPTSAIFTFHEFVAPWIRGRAGLPPQARRKVAATLPRALTSDRGRAEYDLVQLIEGEDGYVAYPLGKGSGSVTTFARADGFHLIAEGVERCEAGERIDVFLLGPYEPPDLVVIGSHCTGLDLLLSKVRERGFSTRLISVGSRAGLEAARLGACDVAGMHLLDPATHTYNRPFLTPGDGIELVPGYRRRQGVLGDEGGRMVNRNPGSGTRILIDRLLGDRRPEGYDTIVRSHQAVAAAVASGRADWGVCIENVTGELPFRLLEEESFDFAVPAARRARPAVATFLEVLADPETRRQLNERGFLA